MIADVEGYSRLMGDYEEVTALTLTAYLKKEYAPTRALHAAKVKMLHGGEGKDYSHPYFWTPYVVFGDVM